MRAQLALEFVVSGWAKQAYALVTLTWKRVMGTSHMLASVVNIPDWDPHPVVSKIGLSDSHCYRCDLVWLAECLSATRHQLLPPADSIPKPCLAP